MFQPNFRGSSGYGQKFIDADRGDFGGGDMRDILSGVDDLIAEGIADRDRLFVYGTSYGGFMTCWLVGQTDRFRAAVAQNAVTDLNMMWALERHSELDRVGVRRQAVGGAGDDAQAQPADATRIR